jgi:hypothetical protein
MSKRTGCFFFPARTPVVGYKRHTGGRVNVLEIFIKKKPSMVFAFGSDQAKLLKFKWKGSKNSCGETVPDTFHFSSPSDDPIPSSHFAPQKVKGQGDEFT